MRWVHFASATLILLAQCRLSSALGAEGKAAFINTDDMMDEDVKPPGQITTDELKAKAGKWEAHHMATLHIVAERREKEFQFKSSREKVNKHADRLTERREKAKARQEKRVQEKVNAMDAEQAAVVRTKELNDKAALLDENAGRGKEKEAKSSTELSVNIKKLEAMLDGEGGAARGDRTTVAAALAAMRVAKAHADRVITGLSKKERQSNTLLTMHAAMEHAVGYPTAVNIEGALKAIQNGALKVQQEREAENKKLVRTARETTNKELVDKEERVAAEKASKEYAQKRKAWKLAKEADHMETGYVYPVKNNKLHDSKYWNGELADKWAASQKRIADEIAAKQHHELVLMETKEKEQKKDEADQYKTFQEQCEYLLKDKQKVLARRADAIAYYNKAMDAVRRPPAGADVHTKAALSRRAEAAKDRMYGANERAADADLQLRKCESQQVRRRRTCACDDPKRRMREMTSREVLLEVDAQPQPSPWIRRRQIKHPWKAPSPTQRRRAYVFDTSHSEKPRFAMLPGAVCPCCASAMRPQRQVCLIKDVKEKIVKNKAKSKAPAKPRNEKAGDPQFHYRKPAKFEGSNPQATRRDDVVAGDKEALPIGARL